MSHSTTTKAGALARRSRYPCVLVVDDNPDDCSAIIGELRCEFPHVDANPVRDPLSWKGCLERGNFDLVITDYRLGWTNGCSILNDVKSRRPECPVIVFTAHGNEEIAVAAMKTGLDDYIVKQPDHYVRLRQAARRLLGDARSGCHEPGGPENRECLCGLQGIGTFRCAITGRLLAMNSAFVNLLGANLRPETPTTELLESFLQLPECARLFELVSQTGHPHSQDVAWKDSTGESIWLRTKGALAKAQDGDVFIEGTLQKVTKLKIAEPGEEKRRRHAAVSARISLLSPRERQVMRLIVSGMTNKLVAKELNISPRTVEMHRAHVMKKLQVRSLVEMVRLAVGTDQIENGF